jgi:diadenylate cyclase
LYRALKDTIAVQILIGLVIIVGLTFITEVVNLRALNWILRTITNVWLLAFVILFHPELRRLLLMITDSKAYRIFVKPKMLETLDIIALSAVELAEKHIGALIVLTRSQNVEMTVVDPGIRLGASVSRELLVSIFNTKAPLHDGAVLIANQVMVAAKVILPLAVTTKYQGRTIGTRHRAGLGLTEKVDAIVLIVSEETGAISIAESGTLTFDIPKDMILNELKSRLTERK